MAQKNRSMAAKAQKANRQKAEYRAELMFRAAQYATSDDQITLVACLARQPDTTAIGNVRVSRCDDVAARKASRRSIIATHW